MFIVMHCGGMPFNGDTVKTRSLGGSESAAYYMAKELAVLVTDDPQLPDDRWCLAIYVDGDQFVKFEDLSSDPAYIRPQFW